MGTQRIRLTDPRRAASMNRRAVEDNIPYPGTVNQPERKFKRRDQYDLDWETVGHPFPDMRHEWKDDARDEIGFGIPESDTTNQVPTVASVRVAASKAVRAAVLLLGEKVDDSVIEAQARDFMALGHAGLDRTIQRFVDSQSLYAADEAEEKAEDDKAKEASEALADKAKSDEKTAEDDKAEDKAEDKVDGDKTAEDFEAAVQERVKQLMAERQLQADKEKAIEAEARKRLEAEDKAEETEDKSEGEKTAEDKAEDKVEDKADEKTAEDKTEDKAEDTAEEKTAADETEEDVDGEKTAEDESDDDDDDDEDDDDGTTASARPVKRRGMNEMDIELSASSEMDTGDVEADPRLAALFDDESAVQASKLASKGKQPRKAGIKELGGQPRAMSASSGGAMDLSNIWDTAPDVSDVFR